MVHGASGYKYNLYQSAFDHRQSCLIMLCRIPVAERFPPLPLTFSFTLTFLYDEYFHRNLNKKKTILPQWVILNMLKEYYEIVNEARSLSPRMSIFQVSEQSEP